MLERTPFFIMIGNFWKKSPVTATIMILNILVFLANVFVEMFTDSSLIIHFGLAPILITTFNQWQRVFLTMFFHQELLHLASNMLGLYILGTALEKTIGPLRYGILYFISGIGSSLSIVYLTTENVYTIGASGAIYGVMAGLLYITFVKPHWFHPQSIQTIRTLAVLNIILTFVFPGISILGHLGGLAIGLLFSVLLIPNQPHHTKKQKRFDYGYETIDGDGDWIS